MSEARARDARGAPPPILLVHGDQDAMVPPANGETLASAIPGAERLLLAGAAHLYFTDAPDAESEP